MLRRLIERTFGRKTSVKKDEPPTKDEILAADTVEAKREIIARENHIISRKRISNNALRVLYRLRDAGFNSYLVGGAVRDLLLGGHPKDFDVATDAHPEQVKALFRNCRLIGRRFRLAHVQYGQEIIEVATFRGTADDGSGARELIDGRIVRDNIYGTIEEDAVRRDFTINALYYAIDDFSIHDFVGGYRDLQNKVLRLIGDPERRFREDPVRMLRAVRFAIKLGFQLDPVAKAAIICLRSALSGAPPARLFDECLKLFLAGQALQSFQILNELGLLQELFPQTARALTENLIDLVVVEAALEKTDSRIREEKPVTTVFVFAALLWPAMKAELSKRLSAGEHDAWANAAQQVVSEQDSRIALPKRVSAPMQDIWIMQSRLESKRRKRVNRLLSHLRFRAAFDFLILRALVEPELQSAVDYFQNLQAGQSSEIPQSSMTEKTPAPKKPRRRRRRTKDAASTHDQ